MKETYDVMDNSVELKQPIIENLSQYITEDNKDLTNSGDKPILNTLSVPLPYDLDIFDICTDERVNSRPRVSSFLLKLKDAIQYKINDLNDIHFNKLSLEVPEKPEELMIDWIFNYFRAFFSFDDKLGDMYGLIINNTQTLEFVSEFKPLIESDYDSIAEKTVAFVVENIRR